MSASAVESRRRRRSTRFGSSSTVPVQTPLSSRLIAMVVPTILCLAHLTFGANQPVAALWLTAILGLALALVLATPLRKGLYDLTLALPLSLLFAAVIAAALWSLTPLTPDGANPLWAWAGLERGAATIDRGATVIEVVKLFGLAAVFVVGSLFALQRERARATVEAVVWVGALYSAISLLTFLAGVQVLQNGNRLSGGFLSFNSGATVFGILVVLSLAVFLRGWKKSSGQGISRRLTASSVALSCLMLSTVCLVLTASRMGLVASAAALAVFLLWELRSSGPGARVSILAGITLLGAVGGVLAFGGNALFWARVGEIDADMTIRGQVLAAHWAAFVTSPLFGYGLGSFEAVNAQIMTAETFEALWSVRATHNVYLQWLEEAGLVGAVPMFALVGLILVISLLRATGRRGQTLQAGLVCAILIVPIHGLTDYALQVPSIAAFWAFLLGIALHYGEGRGG